MMKRKTYKVQLATGESATRHAVNSANAAGRDLLRDYAERNGMLGTWTREDGGLERDGYLVTHAWSVWRHDATGAGQRIVVNLVQPV